MTKQPTARERIEAEHQRVELRIDAMDAEDAHRKVQKDLLYAELAGIKSSLSALGPPPKRVRKPNGEIPTPRARRSHAATPPDPGRAI
jgi:hypothetical protein